MKNTFSESLAGRKRIFDLYPLSFREFLEFKRFPSATYEKYAWTPYSKAWYAKANTWYEEYLLYGGFPEVVLQETTDDKVALLKDIINSYIELDVKLLADYSVGEDLYKLTKLLAARTGSKVDYSKIASLTGINRQKVTSYIQLLESTYMIYRLPPFTKNIDTEISHQHKLYFADTGILKVLAGDQLSSGQVFENAIAAQLQILGDCRYYQKKSGQEIDFIFKGDTAIEVKETGMPSDLQTLAQRATALDIKKKVLICRYPGGGGFADFVWGGNVY
jgi:uncharacterized protein